MRLVVALVSLVVSAWSLLLDRELDHERLTPESWVCREGFCRYDQMFAVIDASGMNLGNVAALLNQDPSNPLVWCTYAELLSASGQTSPAAAAFDRAISLGPGLSPVLMRAANFDFAHGRLDAGLETSRRILGQTDAFDQVVFSYLTRSGLPVSTLAHSAVPPTHRVARAWFSWLRGAGSDEDLRELWSWMRQNQLADRKTAADFAWVLWQRTAFTTAQNVWADWLGSSQSGLAEEPGLSPFDWTIIPAPGVQIRRNNGLDIHFSGTGNPDFSNVRRFTTVRSGRYRFSAEISATDITTDQGPFFHIFDPVNPSRLSVESAQARNTIARSWISLEVPVPPGTQAVEIQVERRPSQKFDNKIGGSLHIYQVSLLPVSGHPY